MDHFRYLRMHLSFDSMKAFCIRYGLPTAGGWDQLSTKIDEEVLGNVQRQQEISDALAAIFEEVLAVGSRAVRLYRVSTNDARQMVDYFSILSPEQSVYLSQYPAPLPLQSLEGIPQINYLCEVKRVGNAVTLVFCRKRFVEERESRSRNQIGDAAINSFGWQDYDEFVFIKRRFVQTYEIVRVDGDRELVELRVENSLVRDTGSALNELQVKINELLTVNFQNQIHLGEAENLFPAIQSLYDNPDEGIVVELGFTTATGSAKHEKMRRAGSDLRNELYHVGGKNAIFGALTPFRIAIRWGCNGQPATEEVLLPGGIRHLSSGSPYLGYMEVKGVGTEERMQSVVEKILAHL